MCVHFSNCQIFSYLKMSPLVFFANPFFLFICVLFLAMIFSMCCTVFDHCRNRRQQNPPVAQGQVFWAGLHESFDSGIFVWSYNFLYQLLYFKCSCIFPFSTSIKTWYKIQNLEFVISTLTACIFGTTGSSSFERSIHPSPKICQVKYWMTNK